MQQLLHGLHEGLPVYHQQEQQRSDLPDGLDGAVYKAEQDLDAKQRGAENQTGEAQGEGNELPGADSADGEAEHIAGQRCNGSALNADAGNEQQVQEDVGQSPPQGGRKERRLFSVTTYTLPMKEAKAEKTMAMLSTGTYFQASK